MQYDTPQPRLTDGIFDRISNSTIRLVVTDSPFVRIYVHNATDFWTIASSANLDCNLAVEGIGGLHDDHFPEAADTCYVIYAAWDSTTTVDDGDLGLFAVPSGTVVNAALLAALTDGGAPAAYDCWSLPIGMAANDALNIRAFFYTHPGRFTFGDEFVMLNGGQSARWHKC